MIKIIDTVSLVALSGGIINIVDTGDLKEIKDPEAKRDMFQPS